VLQQWSFGRQPATLRFNALPPVGAQPDIRAKVRGTIASNLTPHRLFSSGIDTASVDPQS